VIVDAKVVRQNLGLMAAGPPAGDPARHAANLLAAILGDSTGSRLYYALIEPGLADEAGTSYAAMDGAGGLMTFLSCDPGKAREVLATARREFERFLADGPTAAELQAAKNKIATGATTKGELPIGRLGDVGFDWIYRRRYEPLAQTIDEVFAVTADEVHQLARRLDLMSHTLVALGPAETVD
jgi:predicted Zn-dependent peptidase